MAPWIRGVQMGGWLLLERFITPYFFALTTCHLEGDFCSYPDQIDGPSSPTSERPICDLFHCQPIGLNEKHGKIQKGDKQSKFQYYYPTDEQSLMEAFDNKDTLKRYMDYHWDHFVTRRDVELLKKGGVTHLKVPLPYWIAAAADTDDGTTNNHGLNGEPWVNAGEDAWLYFIRFVGWCRSEQLEVWIDLYTDTRTGTTGKDGPPGTASWDSHPVRVERHLQAVRKITKSVQKDGLQDVVTGFGIVHEPSSDVSSMVIRQFNNEALDIVRATLGKNMAVFMGDSFNAQEWSSGWWSDADKHNHTYLDSHCYHVFDGNVRELTPQQHLAYTCEKGQRDMDSCCHNSNGISRMVGEWTAAFDTLPSAKLDQVMAGIASNAVDSNRQISQKRQSFLKNFVKAQMVTYEAKQEGVSSGWFYKNFKMEGGAFAEWDFMKGQREGWIPPIPNNQVASMDKYGSCEEILHSSQDDMFDSIAEEFPSVGTPGVWRGEVIDDDVVLHSGGGSGGRSYGDSSKANNQATGKSRPNSLINEEGKKKNHHYFVYLSVLFFALAIRKVFFQNNSYGRGGYSTVTNHYV